MESMNLKRLIVEWLYWWKAIIQSFLCISANRAMYHRLCPLSCCQLLSVLFWFSSFVLFLNLFTISKFSLQQSSLFCPFYDNYVGVFVEVGIWSWLMLLFTSSISLSFLSVKIVNVSVSCLFCWWKLCFWLRILCISSALFVATLWASYN